MLQRLEHVSLNVADRRRSIAWYRDVLGDLDGHTIELTKYVS